MTRGKTLLSIGINAYDLMDCINDNIRLESCRFVLEQTPQQQTHTINTLIKANCIKRTGRGVYKLTNFGKYILNHLRKKRNASSS